MTGENSSEIKTKGRCLALFPGAFRPPHQAHFATVLNLVSRPDIDEVIIIITNRSRHIPGTSKALEPEVAKKIWSIYLQDTAKVRVEIAPYSAVKQALNYFEKVGKHDTLIFCAGENELREGQGRFAKIQAMSEQYGIAATVFASPAPAISGGATAVRASLAKGNSGQENFFAALPKHLNCYQCQQVWRICRQNMREIDDISCKKISEVISRNELGVVDAIHSTNPGRLGSTYCVQLKTGQRLFVKYGNDIVKAVKLNHPQNLKPRSGIYAERRALKWISRQGYDLNFPKVICFENKSKTLVLNEVCAGGHFLEDDIKQGFFETKVADRLSAFLAQGHRTPVHVDSFWGDASADLQHWQALLELRTVGLQDETLPVRVNQYLGALKKQSTSVMTRGFFHLDFCSNNIKLDDDNIGVIDFELSSSIGDPACDFGFFLGHYLFWGLITDAGPDCLKTLLAAVHTYRKLIGCSWLSMISRVLAFSGAAMIHKLNLNEQPQQKKDQILNIAAELLAHRPNSLEDIDLAFYRVFKKGRGQRTNYRLITTEQD